jgi:hypothetical protein
MIAKDRSVAPSAHGIMQCLRQLAEEAATLNLQDTLLAIERAVETAACETVSFETGVSQGRSKLN